MNLSGLQGGQYRPLSPEQIRAVHRAALKVLTTTGITYEPGLEDTVRLLEDNGAVIDRGKKNIRLPGPLVTEQVARAPSEVLLCGRDPAHDLTLTGDTVYLGTGGAAIKILDRKTSEARATTLKDLYEISRLADQLTHIHFLVRPCIPTDIDEKDYDVNMFYACLAASAKHVMSGVNDEQGLARVIGLAEKIAGSPERLRERPFISFITSFAISPLKLCTQSTRIMQAANREGIPVALSCAPMAGSTSPLTMAGTLVQIHAEQMAGISICQLTRPGAPLLYGGIPGLANLSTMGYSGGAVECGMMNAAIHQMARHIEVPNYNSAGLSDSKLPDAQAGYEKAQTILLAAMGGSNFIHHSAGMLESMLTVALEQYVIDDEIIGNSCRVLKGIDTDPEHLALSVIDAVGPGGNFMTAPHTLAHMRSEYLAGNGVTDRKSREKWERSGSPDTRVRARAIADQLLAGPAPAYIPPAVDRAIREAYPILLPPRHQEAPLA